MTYAVHFYFNESVVLFNLAFISLHQWTSEYKSKAAGWSSIRNHHYHSRSPAAIAATERMWRQHPEFHRVTSTHLSSLPQSFGCCDSSAAWEHLFPHRPWSWVTLHSTLSLWSDVPHINPGLISCRISSKCRPRLRSESGPLMGRALSWGELQINRTGPLTKCCDEMQ